MPLESSLFRGDAKLEACLLQDAAHVTTGAVGLHVSRIQIALWILNGAVMDPSELAQRRYGASTARAVLAFKRDRNIINPAYQTQADDIVGKMTIAALDKGLKRKEQPAHRLRLGPPRLHGSVGRTGANAPADLAEVAMLLWGAGYGPTRARARNQLALAGDAVWPPPGPLPLDAVVAGVTDFLSDQGFIPGANLTPDSAALYRLFVQAVALTGDTGGAMFVPAAGTLREAICNAAKGRNSGACKQEYLDQTRNADLKVPVNVHWCGIYAAWVWRQARALVYFKRGDRTGPGELGGIWRDSPDQFLGGSGKLKFLSPGDILLFSPRGGGRNHHAIVTAVSFAMTRGVPNVVNLIEGNTGPGGPDPRTSVVKETPAMALAANGEEKLFYSVDTYRDSKVRY